MHNPFKSIISQQGYVLLDGGLGTAFEQMGFDLNHPLWSARMLDAEEEAIKAVHLSYMQAGANVIATASYQASYPGCMALGMNRDQVSQILLKSVSLAAAARASFLKDAPDGQIRPLVAASIGPYGAYLANGAEYSGKYDLSRESLYDFHRERWQLLATSGADLMACETIPSRDEAMVLQRLIKETSPMPVIISFSCKNGQRISDGTSLREVTALMDSIPEVIAVGFNCVAPTLVDNLIREVKLGAPNKYIMVYPNSGEKYNPVHKVWQGERCPADFARLANGWHKAGAKVIGGCCRTGPKHIRGIKLSLGTEEE